MQSLAHTVVVIGTGGTIAGTAEEADDNVGYRAGQVAVTALIEAVPPLGALPVEAEQLAQLDSKDMSHAVWRALAIRCSHHLARSEVAGIVVTHGTDTLEETAWFLQRVLAPSKPVVLTAAMRPATALLRDGPQNLLDAVSVARAPGARGVVAVLGGRVYGARDVRKVHPYRIDAFGAGDAGLVAVVEEGQVRRFRDWPRGAAFGIERLPDDEARWPAVEIVATYAGATGSAVRALCKAGVQGLVIAATGNGTVHRDLEAALLEAQRQGVRVLRSSRCTEGAIVDDGSATLPSAGDLTPPKARIELLLELLASGG